MVSREALAKSTLFSSLNEVELDHVARLCEEREYGAQTVLFQERGPASHLYLVQQGKVAIEMGLPSGASTVQRQATVELASQGEVLGWSALVEPYVYTFSAICLQRVRAIAIDGPRLRGLLEQNERMGHRVVNGLLGVVVSRLNATRLLLVTERAWPVST